jgi:hypothetical protein
MGSIPSVNPGVSDLLQTLSSAESASGSTVLSSPAVQSALQNASPGDIVQLSARALQLQEADGLFGSAESTQTAASIILQALNSSKSASTTTSAATSGSTPSSTSSSSTAANALAASQLEEVTGLFGTNTNAGTGNQPLNFLA